MKKVIILIVLVVLLVGVFLFNKKIQNTLNFVFSGSDQLSISNLENTELEATQNELSVQKIDMSTFSFSCPEDWFMGDNLKFNGTVKVKECSKEFSPGDMSFDDGMSVSFYFIPSTSMDAEKWQEFQTLSMREGSKQKKFNNFEGFEFNNLETKETQYISFVRTKGGYIFLNALRVGPTMSIAEYEKTLDTIAHSFVDPTKTTFTVIIPKNLITTDNSAPRVLWDVDDIAYTISIPKSEAKFENSIMKQFNFIDEFIREILSLSQSTKIKTIVSPVSILGKPQNQTLYHVVFDFDPYVSLTKKYIYKDTPIRLSVTPKEKMPFLDGKFCKVDNDCSMQPMMCGGSQASNGYTTAGWPYECHQLVSEGVNVDKVAQDLCKFDDGIYTQNTDVSIIYDAPKCIQNTCTIQNPKAVCTSWK
jgi:hypothetical protein